MSLKLTYFPAAGRAFPIRVALGAAGIEYEDERVGFPVLLERRGAEGFNDAIPLGQLPILTMPDGRVITQSAAIARWAGKKSGLYPTDADAALIVDEVVAVMDEMLGKFPADQDPELKKTRREEYMKTGMPKYFGLVSKRVAASGGPYVTGKDLSIADLVVFGTLSSIKSGMFDHIPKDYTSTWANLDTLFEAVKTHPLVVAHGKLA